MSCAKNKSNKNIIPNISPSMRKNNKTYVWKNIGSPPKEAAASRSPTKKAAAKQLFNPNKYCWVQVSNKYITSSIGNDNIDADPRLPEPINADRDIERIQKNAEKIALLYNKKKFIEGSDVVSYNDPKKFRIVRDFIKKKGLILYGGFAINNYLSKNNKIYKRSELPDYDFFSYDPWKDALELSQILYESGYIYTEIRSGMHSGTFKIYSNFWNVADITYLPRKYFDNIQTVKKNGLRIVSPAQLNIDMYRQLISPAEDISRYQKVYKRQKLIEKWTKPLGRQIKCSDIFIIPEGGHALNDDEIMIINNIYTFTKNKKLIFSGNIAYNTIAEAAGGTERLFVDHLKVLSENAQNDLSELSGIICNLLTQKRLNHSDLEMLTMHKEWQAINKDEHILTYKKKPVCIIVQIDTCTPYIKIFNKYITPIDYIKYELYNDIVFDLNKNNVRSAKCKIRYITALQANYYNSKNLEEFDKSPFQRFVMKCKGSISNFVKNTLLSRWLDIVENKQNIQIIKPSSNKITLHNIKNTNIKIYPKTKTSTTCNKKNEKDCSYPCIWNKKINKCFDEIKGPYRLNNDGDSEPGDESAPNPYYPRYG